jgi:AbrB family looped-hinge helix DNA binding protein
MVICNTMSNSTVQIDKAGRVVIPRDVREELAITAGDLLEITVRHGEVALRPQRERRGFIRRGKALVFSSGTDDVLTSEMAQKVLEQVRHERSENNVKFVSEGKHR